MHIQQTITETRQVFADIAAFVTHQHEVALLQAPPGKWNSAQQVQHLVISQKSTLIAYKVPSFIVGLLYGKRKPAVSRSYEAVRDAYLAHLNQGAKAPAEYIPKPIEQLDKQRLATSFVQAGENYLAALATKTDTELDSLQVKHPLLGKLTLRELALFTLYHNRHHLQSMQTLVTKP